MCCRTGQVASLKRQLEFSQMQVSELQQANADARCRSESQAVDVNDQQRLSEQSLQVRQLTCVIFTALHGMQSQYSDGNSVCLSVRLSVKRMHCDKTEESYVYIFISHERTFILVF